MSTSRQYSADSFETHRLVDADSTAVFVAPDHLLFSRQGMLMAQQFDIARLEVSGTPFLVADQVGTDNLAPGDIALSAAANGAFAYRPVGLGSNGSSRSSTAPASSSVWSVSLNRVRQCKSDYPRMVARSQSAVRSMRTGISG
jgi:hypothetical protein